MVQIWTVLATVILPFSIKDLTLEHCKPHDLKVLVDQIMPLGGRVTFSSLLTLGFTGLYGNSNKE